MPLSILEEIGTIFNPKYPEYEWLILKAAEAPYSLLCKGIELRIDKFREFFDVYCSDRETLTPMIFSTNCLTYNFGERGTIHAPISYGTFLVCFQNFDDLVMFKLRFC